MEQVLVEETMVFIGLMATLGCFTKVLMVLLQRRRTPDAALSPRLDDVVQRLSHIEQTVDATAIEVERISEGQRFTTRLLAERPAQGGAASKDLPRIPGSSTTPH